MPSKKIVPPRPDVVPERDSLIVRHYAEHLEGVGLSDGTTRMLTGTARHAAVWLAGEWSGLDTFDIRLLDRFMRHECLCPGRHRTGRRPGRQRRQFAVRFLRHLLETGHAKAPPEIAAGRLLALQFRNSLEDRGYARLSRQGTVQGREGRADGDACERLNSNLHGNLISRKGVS